MGDVEFENLDDPVTIKIPRDLAIALFEWSYSFMQSPNHLQFTHPADPIGIDHLASELEWELKEVFEDSYSETLIASRKTVVDRYKDKMGERHSEWLNRFPYRDSGE